MSELKVEVVKLGPLEKHANADTLSVTKVWDYTVVVRSTDYKEGDLAAYIPVDTVVGDAPEFAFLQDRKRIKAARLRGIYSEGLLILARPSWKLGDDVASELGCKKYEPPEPISMGGDNVSSPPWFHHYTDIENYRRYPDILKEGEEVVVSEKIHGCVTPETEIHMVDGSKRKILSIIPGDIVLGVDDHGKIVPNKVLQVWKNGRSNTWLNVTGNRRAAGRGSSFFSVKCTPEHKFWVPDERVYKQVKELKLGDNVVLLRTDLDLTPIQEQVLLGKMLGDGSYAGIDHSAHITWVHRQEDREYGQWSANAMGDINSGVEEELVSGYGSKMFRYRTTNSSWIKSKFQSFIQPEGYKRVPPWVADELTPISLAFWYMDDGSLGHHKDQEDRAMFASCAFTEEDCGVLIKGFSKLGIRATYYTSSNEDGGKVHSRIRLDADEAEKMFLLVAPYIVPCMQRKLPERYRGCPGWLPKSHNSYKSMLVVQQITGIEKVEPHTPQRYDLETETHNYFANGVLTHNSNLRIANVDGKLYVGSHRNCKKEDPNNMWWKAVNKLKESGAKFPEGYILHGEVFGQVQDLKYGAGRNDLWIRFFDASKWENGHPRYLRVEDFTFLCHECKLPMVPFLYSGPWKKDLVSLSEGKSDIQGADNIREGIVIKPTHERLSVLEVSPDGVSGYEGRVIFKVISEGYRLRKGGTEKH